MQKESGRRSNRDRREATRAALTAAARALFVEKGYAETGTPEIVARAEVTRGALYHHFADKADLFRAVVVGEAAAVAAQIEADTTHHEDPLEALLAGAESYFAAMAVPGRTRLLLRDGPAVLGHAEINRIDRDAGGGELRLGLAAALAGQQVPPLDALSDLLSAAFDRAAIAVSEGESPDDYRAAIGFLFARLVSAPTARRGTPSQRPSR